MALHDLPFGTITRLLERVAQAQGRSFVPDYAAQKYHTVCPWHVTSRPARGKKEREALQVDNVNNGWSCHHGCGRGGILAVLPRLAPEIAFDRRSSLEWMVSQGLIPPAETPLWKTPEELYDHDVVRRCTRGREVFPSTAAVRNAARRVHLPSAVMEPEPWWEAADPAENADPGRPAAISQTLHHIGCLIGVFDGDVLLQALEREPAARIHAEVLLGDFARNPSAEPFRVHFPNACGLARVARMISDPTLAPIGAYVEAHARAMTGPDGALGVSTWFDPTGSLPARRYHAYQHLLALGERHYNMPWHAVEHRLHADTSSHAKLLTWIDGIAGTLAS